MEIVRGHNALTRRLRSPVVAIGNFDGVHRGHVHIFERAKAIAAELGSFSETVVLTFDPHPAKVLASAYAPPLITPLSRKLELIAQAGIAVTVVQPFDLDFAHISPAEFVRGVLKESLGACGVCVGYDFTFGEKRAGTVTTLEAAGRALGFRVAIVTPFAASGMVCSSTKVREFVLEGRVEGAKVLLGRDPEVEGVVVRGDGRGRKIGVPTANLRADTELLPKNGVYAGWGEIVGQPGRWPAAINIGTNPTFVREMPVTVEAHLCDLDRDLYGQRLRVGVTHRLRAEERFPSVEALVLQIRSDVDATRRMFADKTGT